MIHKEAMFQAFPVTGLLLQASCIEHTFQQTCLNLKNYSTKKSLCKNLRKTVAKLQNI